MKRTIATLGVLGLAAFTVAAPAMAASDKKIIICHAGGGGTYEAVSINVNALGGHDLHTDDIVPPNDGVGARNWDAKGIAVHAANCVATTPPVVVVPPIVVEPPVVVDQPVVEQPVVNQPVVEQPVVVNQPVVEQPVVVPPAAAPVAAAPQATVQRQASGTAAAPAATSLGTNQGYNAQTAVGGPEGQPSWLAGLGALMAAGAAVAVRRRSRTLPLGG